MKNEVPEILYKYRSFNERTCNMLQKNQIYFANPLEFNDPFDCAVQKQVRDNFRNEIAKYLVSIQQEIPTNLVTREQIIRLREQVEVDQSLEITKIDSEKNAILMDFTSKLGILSLSSCNDSILMWSHYADFHRGFCIGFQDYLGVTSQHIREVSYSEILNTRPLFDLIFNDENLEEFEPEFWRLYVLTKHTNWEYEKEWRIIGMARQVMTYSNNCVDRIIFGLRMPNEQRDIIKLIFQGKCVKYFEVIEGLQDFTISIREILD